jgi:hypothetical protein
VEPVALFLCAESRKKTIIATSVLIITISQTQTHTQTPTQTQKQTQNAKQSKAKQLNATPCWAMQCTMCERGVCDSIRLNLIPHRHLNKYTPCLFDSCKPYSVRLSCQHAGGRSHAWAVRGSSGVHSVRVRVAKTLDRLSVVGHRLR